MSDRPSTTHFARRLVFALLWLALFDQFVPAVLRTSENRHYEGSTALRFPASDVFALGPAVSYLREHPARDGQQRVIFLGNSVTYGFGLEATEAVPAQYQRERPAQRVWNMAINTSTMTTSYLIYKNTVDAADCTFIQFSAGRANAHLPALIPVLAQDVTAFHLLAPDPVESRMEAGLGAVWHLYASNYRLQAALFGTSTRQYLYLNKRSILRDLISLFHRLPPQPPVSWASGKGAQVVMNVPRLPAMPDAPTRQSLRDAQPVLWSIGTLASTHRKHVTLLHLDMPGEVYVSELEAGEFNTLFAPYAEVVQVKIPRALEYDGRHMTPEGAHSFADVLARLEPCGGAAQ